MNNNMRQTDENKEKAGAVGGIEAVVKAINTHIDNLDMCKNGCGLLGDMILDNGKSLIKQQ